MPSRQECLHSPGFGAPSSSLPPMVSYELLPNLRAYTQSSLPKVKAESLLRRSMRCPEFRNRKGRKSGRYRFSSRSAVVSLVMSPVISRPASAPAKASVLVGPMAAPMTRRLAGWSRVTLATRSLVSPSIRAPLRSKAQPVTSPTAPALSRARISSRVTKPSWSKGALSPRWPTPTKVTSA